MWVRGGNGFVLRRALADSGAEAIVVALLERAAIAYWDSPSCRIGGYCRSHVWIRRGRQTGDDRRCR